jgi:23S rRNA (cytidine1920-2'-O)/16S rRNA (cytidine1409-2'-O)-methyltransferase
VVRDPGARREALRLAADAATSAGLAVRGFAPSGLPGPKGNRETFVWAAASGDPIDTDRAIAEVEP